MESTNAVIQAEVSRLRSSELQLWKILPTFTYEWSNQDIKMLPELANQMFFFLLQARINDGLNELNNIVEITRKCNAPSLLVKNIEQLHKIYGHDLSVMIVSKWLEKAKLSLVGIRGSISKVTALHVAITDKLEASIKILVAVAALAGQAWELINVGDYEDNTALDYANKEIKKFLLRYKPIDQ